MAKIAFIDRKIMDVFVPITNAECALPPRSTGGARRRMALSKKHRKTQRRTHRRVAKTHRRATKGGRRATRKGPAKRRSTRRYRK